MDRLLRSLERRFTPVQAEGLRDGGVRRVVVLGGGASYDDEVPRSSRLSESSLAHLVEGIRLHRHLQGSKLILLGGRVFGTGNDVDVMRKLASDLGVAPENIIAVAELSPQDTAAQAQNVRALVGGDAFMLVTSASHMPHAVALFRGAGMNPVPAPTHYLSQANQGVSLADLYLSSRELRCRRL